MPQTSASFLSFSWFTTVWQVSYHCWSLCGILNSSSIVFLYILYLYLTFRFHMSVWMDANMFSKLSFKKKLIITKHSHFILSLSFLPLFFAMFTSRFLSSLSLTLLLFASFSWVYFFTCFYLQSFFICPFYHSFFNYNSVFCLFSSLHFSSSSLSLPLFLSRTLSASCLTLL